jgi:hypothetical protein
VVVNRPAAARSFDASEGVPSGSLGACLASSAVVGQMVPPGSHLVRPTPLSTDATRLPACKITSAGREVSTAVRDDPRAAVVEAM